MARGNSNVLSEVRMVARLNFKLARHDQARTSISAETLKPRSVVH